MTISQILFSEENITAFHNKSNKSLTISSFFVFFVLKVKLSNCQ